ncbi:MAG TPA: TlpA disulfide reductase family protein [Ktedonobacterales bacterium]|nr:TlpA disulfide reductase family protein [Ktedonobacterales bacterium]
MQANTENKGLSRNAIVGLALTSLASALLIVLLVARLAAANNLAGAAPSTSLVGHAAPDFTINVWNGAGSQTIHLADLKGKVVLVNFYASWCADCTEEMPLLQRFWSQYQSRDIVFLGVAFQDKQADSLSFLKQYGVTYPCGPDASGTAATDYGVTGVPETVLINQHGVVVQHFNGAVDDRTLSKALQALLK